MASNMQTAPAAAVPESDAIPATQKSKNHQKKVNPFPLTATHFDAMPDSGYVRAKVVLALFGISKATLYRWVLASRIPAPKKIGRTSMYQVGQLRACCKSVQSSGQAVATVEVE